MKKYILLLCFLSTAWLIKSQNSIYTPPIDVTDDISARQYMDIKLFVLHNGKVESYSDVQNAVGYTFQDVYAYLNPCNIDPMVEVDTVMPVENYCEMVFKIKFDSQFYNSFFQYITLRLVGNQVFLAPIYDDLQPNFNLRREDLMIIVQNIIQQIGITYEYSTATVSIDIGEANIS